jgi:hypothetical protein
MKNKAPQPAPFSFGRIIVTVIIAMAVVILLRRFMPHR